MIWALCTFNLTIRLEVRDSDRVYITADPTLTNTIGRITAFPYCFGCNMNATLNFVKYDFKDWLTYDIVIPWPIIFLNKKFNFYFYSTSAERAKNSVNGSLIKERLRLVTVGLSYPVIRFLMAEGANLDSMIEIALSGCSKWLNVLE